MYTCIYMGLDLEPSTLAEINIYIYIDILIYMYICIYVYIYVYIYIYWPRSRAFYSSRNRLFTHGTHTEPQMKVHITDHHLKNRY